MRGTWQGSGTWETTGPGGGFVMVIVLAAAAVSAAEYLLARLWWIIGGTAAVAAVLIVAVRLLIRRQQHRESVYASRFHVAIDRDAPAAVPPAARPELGPGVTIINNFYGADEQVAARVIRRALPGDAITNQEGNPQ